jgi:hypothetical protein
VRGKVAVLDCSFPFDVNGNGIKEFLHTLPRRGAVGVVIILQDSSFENEATLSILSSFLCATAGIPIMLIQESNAGTLARDSDHLHAHPGASSLSKLTAFPGWGFLSCFHAMCLYLPASFA